MVSVAGDGEKTCSDGWKEEDKEADEDEGKDTDGTFDESGSDKDMERKCLEFWNEGPIGSSANSR